MMEVWWCEVNLCVCVCVVFFFFQAEDGIRGRLVTGVQTCALPIYYTTLASARAACEAHRSSSQMLVNRLQSLHEACVYDTGTFND